MTEIGCAKAALHSKQQSEVWNQYQSHTQNYDYLKTYDNNLVHMLCQQAFNLIQKYIQCKPHISSVIAFDSDANQIKHRQRL